MMLCRNKRCKVGRNLIAGKGESDRIVKLRVRNVGSRVLGSNVFSADFQETETCRWIRIWKSRGKRECGYGMFR